MSDVLDADLTFDCPRCGQPASERLYGPCTACRQELVARYATSDAAGTTADEATSGRFEPGMHVVPNHVATKD